LGGVPTGIMKAQLAAMVEGSSSAGGTPSTVPNAVPCLATRGYFAAGFWSCAS
jgi:hypothetical protein